MQKILELLPNQGFRVEDQYLMFLLLLLLRHFCFKQQYNKKDLVGRYDPGRFKIIFVLLTEIVTFAI